MTAPSEIPVIRLWATGRIQIEISAI